MAIEIINCEQGTPEWHQHRCGIVTASRFKDALAGGEGKTRTRYMRDLTFEILTNQPCEEGFVSDAMRKGKDGEADARSLYQIMTGYDVVQVGFIKNGWYGCSPDGLVGDDGVVEFKYASPHILMERHESGGLPSDYLVQVIGGMMVTGRQWCDLMLYSNPKMRPYIAKVRRDEMAIRKLSIGLQSFKDDLDKMVEKHRRISFVKR